MSSTALTSITVPAARRASAGTDFGLVSDLPVAEVGDVTVTPSVFARVSGRIASRRAQKAFERHYANANHNERTDLLAQGRRL